MKHVVGGLAALLVMAAAQPVAAQQKPKPAEPTRSVEDVVESSGIVPALEAVAASPTPELERALGQLAEALTVVAARIAADPELRSSAARAGRGMAEVAEAAVIEQSSALQDALRDLADRLEQIAKERESRD
jgi:SAM-dependent MidA family methyltransferase